MSDQDRKYVDGCAIFYNMAKYSLIEEHLIEFERLATKVSHVPTIHSSSQLLTVAESC